MLAAQFAAAHDNPLATDNTTFTTNVLHAVRTTLARTVDPNSIDYPSEAEIKNQIKQLKSSKAPGLDKIHNTLIKRLP